MIKVAIAGKFDPCHEGHIDHILKAGALGYLTIITHDDEVIKKIKGCCNIALWAREAVLKGLLCLYNIQGCVVVSVDTDGTVALTLKLIKPDIFAKGGDRTSDNMPENEIKVCKEIGCEIHYGVGDLLNASSKMG